MGSNYLLTTPPQVFTSVALFNMLITPLNAFPWVLNGLMEAWVSVQRIQAFLSLKDFDQTEYYLEEPPTETAAHRGKSGMSSIELLFNLLYTSSLSLSLPPSPSPSPPLPLSLSLSLSPLSLLYLVFSIHWISSCLELSSWYI